MVMKGETCELGEFIARSRGWPGPAGMTPPPGQCQVWSLTQFFPVDVSQSRINVKSAFSTNAQSRFASVVVDGVMGPPA